ncbi:MAG: sugar-binding protein, partial [Planctomycetota bacterium]
MRAAGQSAAVPSPGCREARKRASRAFLAAVAVCLLLASAGPPAHGEEPRDPAAHRLVALVLEKEPTLDGDLSDWPERAGTAHLNQEAQVLPSTRDRWEDAADSSATVRVAVDRDALYLGVSVDDDRAYHPGTPWWHGDALELFLDTGYREGAVRPERYEEGCWQIFLMPRNPEHRWGVVYEGSRAHFDDGGLKGIRIGHREREDGYDFEARLPLANFGLEGTASRSVGFALALNDADDGPASPGTYLSWNAGFDLYRLPNRFGTLVLPARPPVDSRGDETRAWVWIALFLLLCLVALGLVAGPGSRVVSRLGPLPKILGLGLTGILAVVYVVDRELTIAAAEQSVRDDLLALAREADGVARDAFAAGALPRGNAAARTRVLEDLLRGRTAPALVPPEEVAFVSLGATDPDPPPSPAYRLALTVDRDLHFARPVAASALRLAVSLPAAGSPERQVPGPVRLGVLTAAGRGRPPVERPVEVVGSGGGRREIHVPLGS